MILRLKLDDGGELHAHVDNDGVALSNVNGRGETTWGKWLSRDNAAELRDFLGMKGF